MLALIWQMLKAGVMEGKLFKKTPEGTPQGGIVSPLLANIYLHEIDKWMDEQYTGLNYNEKNRRRRRKEGNAFYVRYADDFVIAWNGTKEDAQTTESRTEHLSSVNTWDCNCLRKRPTSHISPKGMTFSVSP